MLTQRLTIKDENHLRVIVSFDWLVSTFNKYEIICHHRHSISKLELSQIVNELSQLEVSQLNDTDEAIENNNQLTMLGLEFPKIQRIKLSQGQLYVVEWKRKMRQILNNITNFEPIRVNDDNMPYVIGYQDDFDVKQIIKREYCQVFKTSQLPCPFMLKNKRSCNILNSKNAKITGNSKIQKRTLKHLLNYDHFECFGKKKPMCPNNNNRCIHFENILNDKHSMNDNLDEYFEDQRHLCLYFHKPNHPCARKNMEIMNTNDHRLPVFEFTFRSDIQASFFNIKACAPKFYQSINVHYRLLLLIDEVISNGFEKDLLPTDDSSVDFCKFLKNVINRHSGDRFAFNLNFSLIKKKLHKKYKIFNKLDEKMNHETHKKFGSPLYDYEMLSLILYCDAECNHSLCQSQRDGSCTNKWQCFDYSLRQAISILGQYEIHEANIYTGLAGVLLDINKLYAQGPESCYLNFKTNVSFTRDLSVAREFRGGEGLILGINWQRAKMENLIQHRINPWCFACDVSWISRFPTEQEVLVSRLVSFRVIPSKSMQIGKKQWFVCNGGDDDKVSFDSMFLANQTYMLN